MQKVIKLVGAIALLGAAFDVVAEECDLGCYACTLTSHSSSCDNAGCVSVPQNCTEADGTNKVSQSQDIAGAKVLVCISYTTSGQEDEPCCVFGTENQTCRTKRFYHQPNCPEGSEICEPTVQTKLKCDDTIYFDAGTLNCDS